MESEKTMVDSNISLINKENTKLAERLIKEIEEINLEYDVDMRLFQPGHLEPLSVINKSATEIVEDLKNNVILMSSRSLRTKKVSFYNKICIKLFNLQSVETIILLEKISLLNSLIDSNIFDGNTVNSKKKDECKEELNKILEVLCCNMLLGYLYEVEHPEEYSILYRIMTPASSEKVFCYCTLEDAMNDKN